MPITQYDQPAYTLTCDRDDICGNGPAPDDDGYLHLFESDRAARDWAQASGWTANEHGVLCPPCAGEAQAEREQADEIAAAISYALTDHA